MKLDVARLCLDCEEIHEDQICPICSSEVFAFLTRWIEPSVEPRFHSRRPAGRTAEIERAPANPEQIEAYRQLLSAEPPRRGGLVTKSLLGLAAMGFAGWLYRAARHVPAVRKEEGTREKEEGRTEDEQGRTGNEERAGRGQGDTKTRI